MSSFIDRLRSINTSIIDFFSKRIKDRKLKILNKRIEKLGKTPLKEIKQKRQLYQYFINKGKQDSDYSGVVIYISKSKIEEMVNELERDRLFEFSNGLKMFEIPPETVVPNNSPQNSPRPSLEEIRRRTLSGDFSSDDEKGSGDDILVNGKYVLVPNSSLEARVSKVPKIKSLADISV